MPEGPRFLSSIYDNFIGSVSAFPISVTFDQILPIVFSYLGSVRILIGSISLSVSDAVQLLNPVSGATSLVYTAMLTLCLLIWKPYCLALSF